MMQGLREDIVADSSVFLLALPFRLGIALTRKRYLLRYCPTSIIKQAKISIAASEQFVLLYSHPLSTRGKYGH